MNLPAARWQAGVGLLLALTGVAQESPFRLPTPNRALFEPGQEERFFVGTVGKPWISGTFGCVRSEGRQLHEGLDIRCVSRDRRGEPLDPVQATADGRIVYLNLKPSLSNYGIYAVVRHEVEGLEVYSVYAHLSRVADALRVGQSVRAGDTLGTMGRTANTGQGISRERAHLHFELNLLFNERFPAWYKKTFPDQRNDHAEWNGLNLFGLDPRLVFLEQQRLGPRFRLVTFLKSQPALCRVVVRQTDFPWLRRYSALTEPNPAAATEGVAGYELHLNYNGLPIRVLPRAASELKGSGRYQLLSVDEAEQRRNPARRLVVNRGARWELGTAGLNLLDLLTF